MDGRHARLVGDMLDRVPSVRKRSSNPPSVDGRLNRSWALFLGAGWPLVFALAMALEPAPAHPHEPAPFLVGLASALFFYGMLATMIAAGAQHRSAASFGTGIGLIAVTMSATCPLAGHHTFGLWWIAQFGLVAAMFGGSIWALRSART